MSLVQASQNWRWVFDPRDPQLRIVLDNQHEHVCPYKTSRLVPIGPLNTSFSVADAEAFEQFSEALQYTQTLSSALILSASLNYLIINHFGRPQMPQSWYFQLQNQPLSYPTQLGSLVELNSGLASATFAIVSQRDDVSECMLLDHEMLVSEIKTLRQFDVIKVVNSRLQPASAMLVDTSCDSLSRLA
jgi:cell division protein ZapC